MKKLRLVMALDIDCGDQHCGNCQKLDYNMWNDTWCCSLFGSLISARAHDGTFIARADDCIRCEYEDEEEES